MSERLPLFPLGTVLFPGLVLPLHIFEDRYRALVRHLTSQSPEPGDFGVVAIEKGFETTAAGGALNFYEIGCTASLRHVQEHPDGRFDLVTVGRRRFRITGVDTDSEPYLVAEIEWLPEPDDAHEAEDLVPGLLDLFQRYLEIIRTDGQHAREQLPDDPTVLSYVIAATAILPVDERQLLLAADGTRDRLVAERRMLNRELTLVRQIRALPVPMSEYATENSDN
jgi:Lon protease-like protein